MNALCMRVKWTDMMCVCVFVHERDIILHTISCVM